MNKITEHACLMEIKRLNDLKNYYGGADDKYIELSLKKVKSRLNEIRQNKANKRDSILLERTATKRHKGQIVK